MRDLRYSTIATPESNVRVSTWTEPDGTQHHRMAVNGRVLSEGPILDPCPTCSGPSRETVGLVCQTCGTDYGTAAALDRLTDQAFHTAGDDAGRQRVLDDRAAVRLGSPDAPA